MARRRKPLLSGDDIQSRIGHLLGIRDELFGPFFLVAAGSITVAMIVCVHDHFVSRVDAELFIVDVAIVSLTLTTARTYRTYCLSWNVA